jgi:poly(hydroxyalkanoate) granule-associated protein
VTGKKVAEAAAKASGTWDKLEQVFEDRVARSLSSLGVPTKKDIETLSKRVAELTEFVQNLSGEKPAPRRRAAKK